MYGIHMCMHSIYPNMYMQYIFIPPSMCTRIAAYKTVFKLRLRSMYTVIFQAQTQIHVQNSLQTQTQIHVYSYFSGSDSNPFKKLSLQAQTQIHAYC